MSDSHDRVPARADLDEADLGGDEPCWADRVCPECGRLNEPHPVTCVACGAAFPDAGSPGS